MGQVRRTSSAYRLSVIPPSIPVIIPYLTSHVYTRYTTVYDGTILRCANPLLSITFCSYLLHVQTKQHEMNYIIRFMPLTVLLQLLIVYRNRYLRYCTSRPTSITLNQLPASPGHHLKRQLFTTTGQAEKFLLSFSPCRPIN